MALAELAKPPTEDGASTPPRVPQSQENGAAENGDAGAPGQPKMTWASSGKRSDRKKRSAQQVRPVVSPEKAKSKSPDVLMTSVIETLAQAASVSRSNPGTPQSKLEMANGAKGARGGALKGNQSPKPRKRLFADDATAASALLGLATPSGDSSGRPQKKGKGSRGGASRGGAKKQGKSLMDSLRSQPLKEISGLGPQAKPRNRRKPDHRRYPGPISPLMKLHKRFSAFKGAASSPNAKVLERQLKLQSSLDGLLGWGEKAHAPPGTVLCKIQNCLSPQVRRWCYYEWFYSAIDKPWFDRNTFKDFLDHAGIGHKCKKLQRAEWAMIRRSLGRPRRLSLQFLHEEREELEAYRAGVRKRFKEKGSGVGDLPEGVPRPLIVGQRVTARHPATGQIHDGSILTVDHANSKYRVQFDRQELGVQQLEDVHIMARTSQEQTPLVPIRKPKVEQLGAQNAEGALFTPRGKAVLSAGASAEGSGQLTPGSQPEGREMDMRSLAQVDMLLDLKERLLGLLRQMNDEAEGNLHLDEFGRTSEQFQQNYALLVRNLRECNDRLKSALVRLQQRVQIVHNGLAQQILAATNPQAAQQLMSTPVHAPQKLSSGECAQVARGIIQEAQKATGMSRPKPQKRKSAKAGKGKMGKGGEAGHGSKEEEEEGAIRDLIVNSIQLMNALQFCADRSPSLPSEAVGMAMDNLIQQLKPKSDKNRTLYNDLKKTMGVLKTQLTSY